MRSARRKRRNAQGTVSVRQLPDAAVAQLRDLGVVPAGTSVISEGAEGVELYRCWAEHQTVFDRLEDFDRVRIVRRLLKIELAIAYPAHIVSAAIDWLTTHGVLNSAEFRRLIHCRMTRNDPTARLYRAFIQKAPAWRKTGRVSMAQFLTQIPHVWHALPNSALDPVFGRVHQAPSDNTLARILELGPLKIPAAVYLFRKYADGGTHERDTIAALEYLDAKMKAAAEGRFAADAMEAVLNGLIQEAGADTRLGRKTIAVLSQWAAMARNLRTFIRTLPDTARIEALQFVLTSDFSGFTRTVYALRSELEAQYASNRQNRAAPLSSVLPAIGAIATHRCSEIVLLCDNYEAACSSLGSRTEGYFDFVLECFDQDAQGLVLERPKRVQWRVWTEDALRTDLASSETRSSHSLPLKRKQRGPDPHKANRPLLEYRGLQSGDAAMDPPYFIPLFALDLMEGSAELRPDIRMRRYAMLRATAFPTGQPPPPGLAHFPVKQIPLYLAALNADRILVPITALSLGIQMGALALGMAFETTARAGEILQHRTDCANVDYNESADCAFWRAWPKGFSENTAAGADDREEYCLSPETLEAMENLILDLINEWGAERVFSVIPPSSAIRKPIGNAPWLFRSLRGALNHGHLQYLMSLLLLGVTNTSVHDLRSAVSKFLFGNGEDPEIIQDLLKHRERKNSRRYWAQPQPDDAKEHCERHRADRLERRLKASDRVLGGA